jgi:predicted ATP-dependent serine protease
MGIITDPATQREVGFNCDNCGRVTDKDMEKCGDCSREARRAESRSASDDKKDD